MTHEEFLKELPELVRGYKPSEGVLQHISGITLCMLVGPSGAGKTTIIQSSGLHFVPSDTTRQPRPGERDGVDMNFRSDYDQLASDIKNGELVQIAPFVTGELYATKASSYPESGTAIKDTMASAVSTFRNLGFKETVSAFITPPDYDEWMRRMHAYPLTEEQRALRLHEALNSFEFALSDDQIHFILSDTVDPSVKQLKDLLGGIVDNHRETQARAIATDLQALLLEKMN